MHEAMAAASGWLTNYLVHSAVTMAALGAAAWLGDWLLRTVGPAAQHRLWVAALLLGAMLPLVPVHLPAGSFSRGSADAGSGSVTVTYRMIHAAERWSALPWLCVGLAALYLATVLFSLARLGWRWERTQAMARRSVALPLNRAAQAMVERSAARFAIPMPEVRWLPDVPSALTPGPVVLGAWRAVLLTPEEFFALARGDAEAALAHECAHIARHDYAKNLFYELVSAAVSYHPAARLMQRRLAETRELVCDEMAAGTESERPEYAAALLRLATAMASPHLRAGHAIGVFDGKILEERIMRLTMDMPKMGAARKAALTVMTTAAACTVLGGMAAAATALPFDVMPQNMSTTATKEQIYKVGGDVTPPILAYSVDAKFPKRTKKNGSLQGVVVLGLVVDAQGQPRDIQVKRSLAPDFDRNAIDAVRQYKFKPALRKGEAVAVAINIEVNFHRY